MIALIDFKVTTAVEFAIKIYEVFPSILVDLAKRLDNFLILLKKNAIERVKNAVRIRWIMP